MKKKGSSRMGLFREIKHYDEKGRKIGESRPSFFGGHSDRGLFGDWKDYSK